MSYKRYARASDILGDYVGPLEYKGYLVFDYPEGDNPIVNIVFTVDPMIAGNLILVDVPSPWSYGYSVGVLTLSGGSLSPGGAHSFYSFQISSITARHTVTELYAYRRF